MWKVPVPEEAASTVAYDEGRARTDLEKSTHRVPVEVMILLELLMHLGGELASRYPVSEIPDMNW